MLSTVTVGVAQGMVFRCCAGSHFEPLADRTRTKRSDGFDLRLLIYGDGWDCLEVSAVRGENIAGSCALIGRSCALIHPAVVA
jgi:hypothetical protein